MHLIKKMNLVLNYLKKNKSDPLKKTLVIIDEAHNLYNKNLSSTQKPNLNIITKMIHNSYKKSGDDSVRVLLLSATPITNDIIGFAKMFNLLIPKKQNRLETKLEPFLKTYMNDDFTNLNKNGKDLFKKIGKYVSYLNISNDKNIFAQPVITNLMIKLSGENINDVKKNLKYKEDYLKKKCNIKDLKKFIKKYKNKKISIEEKLTKISEEFEMFEKKDIRYLLEPENFSKEQVNEFMESLQYDEGECKLITKEHIDHLKKLLKNNRTSQIKSINKCNEMKTAKNKESCFAKSTLYPGSFPKKHRFENKEFNKKSLKKIINEKSPKIKKLIDNIRILDEDDMKKFKTKFKHIIYVHNSGYNGLKLVISSLMAYNFNLQIQLNNKKTKLVIPKINKDSYNMVPLIGSTIYKKAFSKRIQKEILTMFNDRENNTYGENIRFILIDKNFLEGIDIFDVKYLHVIDPYLFTTEITQLIGRGTRTCGQNGLPFNNGWTLNVINYNSYLGNDNFDEKIKDVRLNVLKINKDIVKTRDILENTLKDYAIDRGLTDHNFEKNNKGKIKMRRLKIKWENINNNNNNKKKSPKISKNKVKKLTSKWEKIMEK